MSVTKCPGCGLELPDRGRAERMNASQACWELYGELAAYTLARGRDFLHQYGVDAYQAQHALPGASGITIAFSLLGLYLAMERGSTGLQVQRAHMALAREKIETPRFDPPREAARLTVRDVLNAEPGDARDAALKEWCAAVWESWRHAQAWTRHFCEERLAGSFSRRVRSR
ncbi:MAG TPA: DUF5946 family protein [Bryobacteraceae bacterium]|jgi:hypothetical protein|nr:DUF5946 family protein [Bryobacteraceae bacterium]